MIKAKLKVLPIEVLANTITHGLGLVLSVIGFVMLVVLADMNGDRWSMISCIVYRRSLVALYAASTFYHSSTSMRAKKNLQVVDHCCIYLLIAGSYTPFGMVIFRDELGPALLAGIWGFAAVGILIKIFIRDRFPAINVISYLLMGWLGIFAVQPLFNALGIMPVGIFAKIFTISFIRYLVFAGIAYLFFYVWKKEKFLSHKIQNKFPTNLVIRNEFVYSLISILLFSLVGVGVSLLHRAGYTKIYETFSDYGWGYFLLSTLLMILAHDTYFYWMHRLIHDKRIYKYVHKVHHQSINPTPWAAFSFHPTEAILEVGILPIMVFLIPLSPLSHCHMDSVHDLYECTWAFRIRNLQQRICEK